MKLRYVVLPLFAVFTLNGCYSLIGSAVASGILAAIAIPSFVGSQDASKNSQVRTNAKTLQLALEIYATDHDGLYPDLQDWQDRPALPANPFGKPSQATLLGPSANLTGPGEEPTAKEAVLGKGKAPGEDPYDVLTYGALVCAVSADRKSYVVYGIGKHANQAVVVVALSDR